MNDQIKYPDGLTIMGSAELTEEASTGIFFAKSSSMMQNTDNRKGTLIIESDSTYLITTGQSSYPASMKNNRVRIPFQIESKTVNLNSDKDNDGPISFFIG